MGSNSVVSTGAFFILPLLSAVVSVAVMIIAVVALWRIMKAQEATAHALRQIADTFRARPT